MVAGHEFHETKASFTEKNPYQIPADIPPLHIKWTFLIFSYDVMGDEINANFRQSHALLIVESREIYFGR